MLKKIKLIQGIGDYKRVVAGNVDFKEVTVIYGENRNGKSTLCDVLHSLDTGEPGFILNRETIPNNPKQPATVKIVFEKKDGSNFESTFNDGQWQQTRMPDCSKLYVFDHAFIHRNVITGQKLERHNSENVTNFILGEENAVLFQQLEELNTQLRLKRDSFQDLTKQFATHEITNHSEYANSPLSQKSREELLEEANAFKQNEEQAKNTIQNAVAIKNRRMFDAVGQQVSYDSSIELVNSMLTSTLQDVHQISIL